MNTRAGHMSLRLLALRLGGSALMLFLLFRFLPMDALWSAFGRINPVHWIAALGMYMTLHLIGVAKWRMLINAAGAALPARTAVRAYYVGLFGNTFLPSVVGGDVLRAGVALRSARSAEALVLGSLVDRVQDVAGLAAVAAVGALLLPTALDPRSRGIFWALLVVAAAGLALVLVLVRLLPARRLPRRVRRRLARVRSAYRALRRSARTLAAAFLLGMLLQTLQIALNMWLARMIGLDIGLAVWLLAWPLAKIAATLPITQGGLGVREAALAALLAPFGVAPVLAVGASLLFQAVVISGGLLGGMVSLVAGRVIRARAQLPQELDGGTLVVPRVADPAR